MSRRSTLLPAILLALASSSAQAAGPRFALLLAPQQLTIPQVELTGDLRLSDRASVAGILGLNLDHTVALHHMGGQFRYTFSGNWPRGAFLGGEVVTGDGSWLHRSSDGVAFGGFVGARYTFAPALSLEASIGGKLWWVSHELRPGATANLGVGWTF